MAQVKIGSAAPWRRCATAGRFTSMASGVADVAAHPPFRDAVQAAASRPQSFAAARLHMGIVVARDQPLGDARADEMRNVAAQRADFLDKARGDELVAVRG